MVGGMGLQGKGGSNVIAAKYLGVYKVSVC